MYVRLYVHVHVNFILKIYLIACLNWHLNEKFLRVQKRELQAYQHFIIDQRKLEKFLPNVWHNE